MENYFVNNKSGIFKNEIAIIDLLKSRAESSINKKEPISFYLLTNFSFFECFKKTNTVFLELFEKKILGEIKVVFAAKNKLNLKEFYKEFKKDAISLDSQSYDVIEKLYGNSKIEISIFTEKPVDTNLIIIKSGTEYETWVGSISLSAENQNDRIEFILPADKNADANFYYKLFDYFRQNGTQKLYDKDLIDIVKKSARLDSLYLNQKDFISTAIKSMEKDFLVKNLGSDLSLFSEMQHMSYYQCLDILKNYGLAFLFNTAGLGKTEISGLIIKYYKENDKNILIVHAPGDLKKWQYVMNKNSLKNADVTFLSRSELLRKKFVPSFYNDFDLIIVSESEIFRNSHIDNYLNANLKEIIKFNKNSDFLLISDFFSVSSLLDFSRIVKLFGKIETHSKFTTNKLLKKIEAFENESNNDKISLESFENMFDAVSQLSINIKQTDFKAYFNSDFTENPEKSTITQVKYAYTHEIYVKIYEKLPNFLRDLSLDYIKLQNKKIESIDINYYRWRIYKKLESSIYSFRICIKNMLDKNQEVKKILEENTFFEETFFTRERQDNILNNFKKLDSAAQDIVMKNIEKDIKNIESAITNIEQIKYLENHDDKITNLLKILKTENKPTLIFSESKDTVLYIERRLKDYGKFKTVMCYGNEQSFDEIDLISDEDIDRNSVLNSFNEGENNILISTDILDENFVFGKAEILVNFDMNYNPSILLQRANKLGKNFHSKKTKIFNFQPDRRIDKEIGIYESLQLKSSDIFAYLGFDFIMWILKDKKLDFSEINLEKAIYLARDYKDLLSMKNPEDFQIKNKLKTLEDNIILREYIKYFNISEDTIKYAPLRYNKPVYTTFKSKLESYFIFFEYENEVYSLNNLIFSEIIDENEISSKELTDIENSILDRIDEINKKLNKTEIIDIKKIPMGIIKYFI
ncbi:MAG TPA: DEAD/DEAH box helicase [Spirochaetota bacterium]|nr:DEAD/DEAH box helicase [Spirochaetota bacterium]